MRVRENILRKGMQHPFDLSSIYLQSQFEGRVQNVFIYSVSNGKLFETMTLLNFVNSAHILSNIQRISRC